MAINQHLEQALEELVELGAIAIKVKANDDALKDNVRICREEVRQTKELLFT